MKARLFLAFALLVLPLQACIGPIPLWNVSAASMALEGKKTPDLDAIRIGATRGEVELALGSPLSTTSASNGDDGTSVYIFEYEVGNEPSDLRAIAHISMSNCRINEGGGGVSGLAGSAGNPGARQAGRHCGDERGSTG